MPTCDTTEEIADLEARLVLDPDNRSLREDLLMAYSGPGTHDQARWCEHILWCIWRYPQSDISRCPFTHFHPESSPTEYTAVEQERERLYGEHPDDSEIGRGLALFTTYRDRERALDILDGIVTKDPT